MARKSHPGMGNTKLNGQLALPLIKACSNQHDWLKERAERGHRARVTRKLCWREICCWVPMHTSSTERARAGWVRHGHDLQGGFDFHQPLGRAEPWERLGSGLGRFAANGPGAPSKSVLNLEGTRLALIPGIAGAAARKTALFTSKETGSGDTG